MAPSCTGELSLSHLVMPTSLRLYKSQWLALLPDDRLLLNDGRCILLFDLNVAPVSNLPPTQRNQPPAQEPLARLPWFVHAISPSFLVQDTIRYSIFTREGIKGLIVPRTKAISQAIDCVDLFSHPNFNDFAHLGYDRALLCSIHGPTVLQYVWPGEHSSSVVSQKCTIQVPHCSELLFDEYSSRLVTLRVRSTIIYTFDFAAI